MSRDRLKGAQNYQPAHINQTEAFDMDVFRDEVTAIQDKINTYSSNIQRIGELQTRILNSTDETAAARQASQLDTLTEETSVLAVQLRREIKGMEARGGDDRDGQVRAQQADRLKTKFVNALEQYQQSEYTYRTKYKERITRQLKIVKPNATQDEINSVVNNPNGGQVFEQALMDGQRVGESRSAYREVQDRHKDLQRIERTIAELAQLFTDMATVVEKADDQIKVIEQNAYDTELNTEKGLDNVVQAKESAARARRGRKICFILTIVIILVLALAIGVPLGLQAAAAARANQAASGK
jgi:syntaxin 1B/2/3